MADFIDLKSIIQDESKTLSDLDWLDVDEQEYREYEKLPKQNLDAIPDLEAQWKYLTDEDKYRLSPENREPSKPNTPFWSEREIKNDLTDDAKVAVVEKFLKKHLMAGATAKEASSLLKSHFDKRVLKEAKAAIKKTFSERGLLGTVYVDAELFPKCDQGEGQDFVDKYNKEAKFVVAKDKCSGCVWAKEGKCSRFQKELVFDVQYTEDTWAFYREKAKALGKDLSQVPDSLPPREKIKQASLAPQKDSGKALDRKPVVRNLSASVSSKEAFEGLDSAEIHREVVSNVYRSEKLKKVGQLMLGGNHGPEVRDAIASDPDLQPLKPHLHLMGRLYADLSLFDTREAANEYLEAHKGLLTFGNPSSEEKVASNPSFDLKSSEAINKILHRYALSQYGHNYLESKGEILRKMGGRLASFDDRKLHEFAQNVFANPLPQKTKQYEHLAPSIYDPTRGISSPEARQTVANTDVTREKVENQYRPKIERKLAHKMLEGGHSDAMEARLASEGFDDLKDHLHLMGKLYVLSSYVSEKELKHLTKKNAQLKHLPVLDPSELEGFLNKSATKKKILLRYSKVRDISSSEGKRKILASLTQKLQGMSTDEIRSFAQMVYQRPLLAKNAKYSAHGQHHDPTQGLTEDQAQRALSAKKVIRASANETSADMQVRNRVARRMLEGDHGPAIKAMIDTDPVLAPLKPHYKLLGRLYTASFPFSQDKDLRAFKTRNAHLQTLPEMKDMEKFYQLDSTKEAILTRMALIKGYHPEQDKKAVTSFVEERKSSLESKPSSALLKIAQNVFSKDLPSSVRTYDDAIYSTTQVKEGEMEVSDQDLKSFKTKINNKKAQKVTRDLRYFLKRGGGKKVLATLNAHFGMDVVQSVWLSENKTSSSSVHNYSNRQKAERQVLATTTDPHFEPVGNESVLMPEFFETKIGRWLRDRMIAGSYGAKLSSEIKNAFSEEEIIKNAPIILAMREEEGLYGKAYSTADSFADCAVGKRAVKSTVSQIVKGSKCDGCVYNKNSSCLLYGKDLNSTPQYDREHIQTGLSSRVQSGHLTKRDVSDILAKDMGTKEKVRLAHTVSSNTEVREADIAVSGHYGTATLDSAKAEKRVASMLYEARNLLVKGQDPTHVKDALTEKFGSKVVKMGSVYLDQIIERTQNKMSDFIEDQTLHARTGLEQMEDMELTSSQVSSELGDIEFNQESKKKPMEGVTFGGFTME